MTWESNGVSLAGECHLDHGEFADQPHERAMAGDSMWVLGVEVICMAMKNIFMWIRVTIGEQFDLIF